MSLSASVHTLDWTLGRLAETAGCEAIRAGRDLPVSGVRVDSRECVPGDVFVAISGSREDGLRFAADAVERGAVAVASESDPGGELPWLAVDDARSAAGRLSDLVYGDPSRELRVVGITGTNGKTTTAHLFEQLWPGPVGVIGTLGVRYPGFDGEDAVNTTPEPTALRRHLRAMVDAGCEACAMEVSSHALEQGRVDGLRFSAAIYTNLSGDHLDYHGTMAAYAAAKARLFHGLDGNALAILNAGDEACRWVDTSARKAWFEAESVRAGWQGTEFVWRGRPVRLPLLGRHNAHNAAAALEAACGLGADAEEMLRRLSDAAPVRGRLEPVQRRPVLVVVDYAHTDDALEHALRAVRELVRGRVILVFGCGGDRDRSKRPRMGAVAARRADRIYVTNDNPRGEDPSRIAREIAAGMGDKESRTVLDRRAAIEEAIAAARPGDVVLIAGKGHETYQLVGRHSRPFDDAAVAREILTCLRP